MKGLYRNNKLYLKRLHFKSIVNRIWTYSVPERIQNTITRYAYGNVRGPN